ncbi:MAG TPA: hypothetical protein VF846_00695 [Thermoanaerobaculia bacterium]|jgi:hypothetical protein
MPVTRFAAALTLFVSLAAPLPAQTTTPPAAPPSQPQSNPSPSTPGVLSDAAASAYERRDNLPAVNIYLPEGQASVRLRKLIRNVLFESQIDYEFVNGDISTFLRYKYYARNYTYRLGLFDSIEFPDLASGGDNEEYERVRGGLLLVGVPRDYNNRYFFLVQNDQLTFGDLQRPDNQTSNIYTKIGYQYGTQFDERMNAIVGEQRGRITPVLTAFREIGPQRTGLAAAVTQAANVLAADYNYTKFEMEGLRRFDLTETAFIFSRLHLGTFLSYSKLGADELPEPEDRDGDGEPDVLPQWQRYDLPQYELFRLGGREALKSVRTNDRSIGTHEVHLTNEFFAPVFRNKDYSIGSLHWNTMYGVAYLGAGAVAFETDELTDPVVDVGLGTESALTFGDYDVYLSILVAHTVVQPDDIKGGTRFLFAVRTVR